MKKSFSFLHADRLPRYLLFFFSHCKIKDLPPLPVVYSTTIGQSSPHCSPLCRAIQVPLYVVYNFSLISTCECSNTKETQCSVPERVTEYYRNKYIYFYHFLFRERKMYKDTGHMETDAKGLHLQIISFLNV